MLLRVVVLLCVLFETYTSTLSPYVEIQEPLSDGRIVGGVPTSIQEHPYQLSLLYRNDHICGASLIHSMWAVTAGHCVHGFDKNLLAIRAGSSIRNSGGQVVRVGNARVHPYYNPNTIDFDIAILQFVTPVTISTARTITIPSTRSSIPQGAIAVVTGWGNLQESGPRANQLQVLRIPIIPRGVCQQIFYPTQITERMICAGDIRAGGKDSCYGDSGGPLVINGVLYGIVSWGYGCSRYGYPGVYSNVPVLSGFIRQVVTRTFG